MQVFYSIVIPVYNCDQVIARCIDSVIKQSFEDFELLLIDDGSTDQSGKICDSYAETDNRITVIHKRNAGVSSARNTGLLAARGKCIVFIDADDYVEEDYLLHLEDFCKEDRFVVGGYIVKNEELSTIRVREHEFCTAETTNCGVIARHYEEMDFDCVWGKVFCRKDIITSHVRFDEEMDYGEDSKFVVEMLRNVSEISFAPYSEYCHIKYNTPTLSTFASFENAINRIETECNKVFSCLCVLIGATAEECIINKTGEKYSYLFLDAISKHETDTKLIHYFYRQKWFRKILEKTDSFFQNESPKFRWLLKTKSATLMSLYLSSRMKD